MLTYFCTSDYSEKNLGDQKVLEAQRYQLPFPVYKQKLTSFRMSSAMSSGIILTVFLSFYQIQDGKGKGIILKLFLFPTFLDVIYFVCYGIERANIINHFAFAHEIKHIPCVKWLCHKSVFLVGFIAWMYKHPKTVYSSKRVKIKWYFDQILFWYDFIQKLKYFDKWQAN